MTWIKVLRPGSGDATLDAAYLDAYRGYPFEYSPAAKKDMNLPAEVAAESIVASHSLIPDALRHMFAGYGALLHPDLPLSRRQHELIATVVSALNDCFY
ncbi:MAG TPA: hypothetical protein VFU21_22575 [Kofleriaceae bacterium]|nr:hypothetical protein [Kofleriaceae bacterium]